MSSITPELLRAYHKTSYLVFSDNNFVSADITLRIGESSAELDSLLAKLGVSQWRYMTAHNPRSTLLGAEENLKRHESLISMLESSNYRAFPGRSIADESDWPDEDSLLILNMELTVAISKAREYGQLGILSGKSGSPVELVLC